MEPSSEKTQEENTDTVSRLLTENNDELKDGVSENLTEETTSRHANDVDNATSNGVNELQLNSRIDSCITSLCELQGSLEECEKQIDEQILVEEITGERIAKNCAFWANRNPDIAVTRQATAFCQSPARRKTASGISKKDLLKIIKNLSVIIAYPSKQKQKQPLIIRPPGQSGSGMPPRPPLPPRPPPAVPQHPDNQNPQPGANQATTHQPRPTQRGTQTIPSPAVPIFIDSFPIYPAGPALFMPAALYSTVVWAPLPAKIPPNIPNCLAHLVVTDSFYVVQMSWFDYFSDLEEFFLIQNKNGECLYFVYETTDFGEFALCESYRGYRLHVLDMYQNEVIFMNKLSGCTSCCCCYPEMLVYAPPGTPVGAIKKKFNFTREEYALLDPDRNRMFKMLGPCCATCCCWTLEADFTIHAMDSEETEVGFIRREAGFLRSYTGYELFGLTLPMDMDVRIKAVFLGALFLIVR